MTENALYDAQGNRLYLNADERAAFIEAARSADRALKCFCHTLHYSGCRLSEALELACKHVNLSEQCLHVRCLKKRGGKVVFRDVPVPPALVESLDNVFGIRETQKRGQKKELEARLWSWSRVHAWRLVKDIMNKADIPDGSNKSPKGLRHGFGVNAIRNGIPLNMLQKWMGHSDMKTTAIYANALGDEEREIAAKMW